MQQPKQTKQPKAKKVCPKCKKAWPEHEIKWANNKRPVWACP